MYGDTGFNLRLVQDFLSAYFVVCVGFIVHAKRTCTDEFIFFQKKRVALRLELSMALPSDLSLCMIRLSDPMDVVDSSC